MLGFIILALLLLWVAWQLWMWITGRTVQTPEMRANEAAMYARKKRESGSDYMPRNPLDMRYCSGNYERKAKCDECEIQLKNRTVYRDSKHNEWICESCNRICQNLFKDGMSDTEKKTCRMNELKRRFESNDSIYCLRKRNYGRTHYPISANSSARKSHNPIFTSREQERLVHANQVQGCLFLGLGGE